MPSANASSFLPFVLCAAAWLVPAASCQNYTVTRDPDLGVLSLLAPNLKVSHDLRSGGAISTISLTHGTATNLLVTHIGTFLRDTKDNIFTDLRDRAPRVTHRTSGPLVIVVVESALKDAADRQAGVELRTTYEYHHGFIKIRREYGSLERERWREVRVVGTRIDGRLDHYGFRQGKTEREGVPPFDFGSCQWGKVHAQASPLTLSFLPRYVMLANPGVEGLEWFMGSNLSQWDLQLSAKRGEGSFVLKPAVGLRAIDLAVSPFCHASNTVAFGTAAVFDFYLGLPLLEGHALNPWFHASFNRNRGDWVSTSQLEQWRASGIQTVHCHNDGDYYGDGLFWRDGSYPPYPDMTNYDHVVRECHRRGIGVATYFSNKELHPDTPEFRTHGNEWGRKNLNGDLQHNFYKPNSEFGAQMCLRSGWKEFLQSSVERVLTNHPLDGVYYDWNVALVCYNGLHEGKPAGQVGDGHWDIDELLSLMEWTRQRVGPQGLAIVHNTTTPMFSTENFASHVVANEWGYGKWQDQEPGLADLPLEWSLVGARPRGVISYGQIDAKAPPRLHRVFAIMAMLSGVAPWPMGKDAFDVYAPLKTAGNLERFTFVDWRNQLVTLEGDRCATAIYSRPGEALLVLANLTAIPRDLLCKARLRELPHPINRISSVTVCEQDGRKAPLRDGNNLDREGVRVRIPADTAILLEVK